MGQVATGRVIAFGFSGARHNMAAVGETVAVKARILTQRPQRKLKPQSTQKVFSKPCSSHNRVPNDCITVGFIKIGVTP